MSHMRIIIAGVFGPDSSRSPSSKSTSSHSLMAVLKIREKGGEASWLMAGSHVDRLQLQSRLKNFSPTNLANQFVQSALTVSLALAELVALARYAAGRPAGMQWEASPWIKPPSQNMVADLNLVDAFEKSKARLINFPRSEKKVMCMCVFFVNSRRIISQIPDQPLFCQIPSD